MENQAPSKGIILNYGIIYGVVAVLSQVILYASGTLISIMGGIVSLIVLVFSIIGFPIMSISKYKKTNGGYLSWVQAVKIGIGVVVLGSLISIAYNHLFTELIEPTFYEQAAEFQREVMIDAGMTDEQINSRLQKQAETQGTLIASAQGLLLFAFFGFVVSAIAGAVMKRKPEDEY